MNVNDLGYLHLREAIRDWNDGKVSAGHPAAIAKQLIEYGSGPRGSGKTHKLVQDAPDRAVFVVNDEGTEAYVRHMAGTLGKNINVVPLDGDLHYRIAGRMAGSVILDHEVMEHGNIDHVRLMLQRMQQLKPWPPVERLRWQDYDTKKPVDTGPVDMIKE